MTAEEYNIWYLGLSVDDRLVAMSETFEVIFGSDGVGVPDEVLMPDLRAAIKDRTNARLKTMRGVTG